MSIFSGILHHLIRQWSTWQEESKIDVLPYLCIVLKEGKEKVIKRELQYLNYVPSHGQIKELNHLGDNVEITTLSHSAQGG